MIRSGSIFVMVWKFEPLIIDKKVRTETFEPQKMPLRWQKFDFWRFGSNQNTINWQFKIFSHQNYWIQTEIKEYQNPIFLCFWLLLQSKQYLPEELLQDSLWLFRTICSSKTNLIDFFAELTGSLIRELNRSLIRETSIEGSKNCLLIRLISQWIWDRWQSTMAL